MFLVRDPSFLYSSRASTRGFFFCFFHALFPKTKSFALLVSYSLIQKRKIHQKRVNQDNTTNTQAHKHRNKKEMRTDNRLCSLSSEELKTVNKTCRKGWNHSNLNREKQRSLSKKDNKIVADGWRVY